MPTIRIGRRTSPFVQADRQSVNDPRLSFKATGILVYLLAKPDDWVIRTEQLAGAKREGRDAVRSGLQELKTCGYLVAEQPRAEDGTFEPVDYVLRETAIPVDLTANGFSGDGLPAGGLSGAGESNTTNKDVNNKRETNIPSLREDGGAGVNVAVSDKEKIEALVEDLKTRRNKQAGVVAAFEYCFPDLDPPSFKVAWRLYKRMENADKKKDPGERLVRAFVHVRDFVSPHTTKSPVEVVFQLLDLEKRRLADTNFTPPTTDQVEAYFAENGSDAETGRKFYRSFEARSWRLYGDPVTNFRPLADSWIERGESFDEERRLVFNYAEAVAAFDKHRYQKGRTLAFDEMFETEPAAGDRPAKFVLRPGITFKQDRR